MSWWILVALVGNAEAAPKKGGALRVGLGTPLYLLEKYEVEFDDDDTEYTRSSAGLSGNSTIALFTMPPTWQIGYLINEASEVGGTITINNTRLENDDLDLDVETGCSTLNAYYNHNFPVGDHLAFLQASLGFTTASFDPGPEAELTAINLGGGGGIKLFLVPQASLDFSALFSVEDGHIDYDNIDEDAEFTEINFEIRAGLSMWIPTGRRR